MSARAHRRIGETETWRGNDKGTGSELNVERPERTQIPSVEG